MSNIKDIARIAGVSVTTVSRVLNNERYVSDEKRNAVLRAIEITNYQRNLNAVNLSKGKTHLIGVVVPYSNHPYFGLLIEGISIEAIKKNYKLVLFQTDYHKERELEALEMLKHKQIDSLIICSRICPLEVVEAYLEYGPVILCEDTRNTRISSTFVDHYKSFTIALEYMYKKGHRKIGYCIGRSSGTNSLQRNLAYKDFLLKNNLPYHDDQIIKKCSYFEDGERIVNTLIKLKNRPTALLVTSDQVAAGILTCCNEKGIVIPEDLAIISFDNQPIAKYMKLTTVEMPIKEMGQKLLHQALLNEQSQTEMSVTLIERSTV